MTKDLNMALLSQVLRIYEDRRHPGLNKVKTRAEVNDSTRKIYKQKGTGGARHGAKSAPIFVGGGIAHGPKGIKRELKLPKKIAKKALQIALVIKKAGKRLIEVPELDKVKKTSEAKKLIEKALVGLKGVIRITVVLNEKTETKAFRNLSNVVVSYKKDLNAYDVYYGGVILMAVEKKAKK